MADQINYDITKSGMKTERIKTLKVIGQVVAQVVFKNRIPICAKKIDRMKLSLGKTKDHVFRNKIVTQGTIRKEIYFVDLKGKLRFLTEEIPLMFSVDIPGLSPKSGLEIQTHLLDIDVDYRLCPPVHFRPGCLHQVVVARILVVAAKWVQMDVLTKDSPFTGLSSSTKYCRIIR